MYRFLFWSNFVSIFYLFILPVVLILAFNWSTYDIFSFFFLGGFSSIKALIFSFLSICFWLKCIKYWLRYDKRFTKLLLLLFLNAFYTPFYYLMVIKKGVTCNLSDQ